MDRTDSEKLIIELNFRNSLIDERQEPASFDSRRMLELLPESIVDKRTLNLCQIHELFQSVDHTMTAVGSARLFHSLANPPESIELIHAKHDSFYELSANPRLQKSIVRFLQKFEAGEKQLFRFINAHMHPLMSYRDFKRTGEIIQDLVEEAGRIEPPETVYLDSLIKSIQSFAGSPTFELLKGPLYRTAGGIKTRREKSFFTPGFKFRPSRLSFGSVAPSLPGILFGLGWLTGLMERALAEPMFYLTAWLSALGIIYGFLFKPMIDYDTAVLPARKRLIESNRFASAIEGVAAIDELLSFVAFSETFPHPTVIPDVTSDPVHVFEAKELRNPVLASVDKNYVPCDVNLSDARITFITGPNSGGKTTFCKTIVQNQILAQTGAPVVARQAKINMADMITYQAPFFDTLNDPEGRFGTELKVTRDIFFNVTPRSLTILDEIAEGTTTHEKLSLSENILKGFLAIGNNTLMVTHSHEMVDNFRTQNKAQCLQMEFSGKHPTHRLINGISRESHAHRVAEKIGFSPEDIERHLRKHGYI